MTKHGDLKARIRALAAEQGEGYVAARQAILQGRPDAGVPGGSPVPGTKPPRMILFARHTLAPGLVFLVRACLREERADVGRISVLITRLTISPDGRKGKKTIDPKGFDELRGRVPSPLDRREENELVFPLWFQGLADVLGAEMEDVLWYLGMGVGVHAVDPNFPCTCVSYRGGKHTLLAVSREFVAGAMGLPVDEIEVKLAHRAEAGRQPLLGRKRSLGDLLGEEKRPSSLGEWKAFYSEVDASHFRYLREEGLSFYYEMWIEERANQGGHLRIMPSYGDSGKIVWRLDEISKGGDKEIATFRSAKKVFEKANALIESRPA